MEWYEVYITRGLWWLGISPTNTVSIYYLALQCGHVGRRLGMRISNEQGRLELFEKSVYCNLPGTADFLLWRAQIKGTKAVRKW